jgi:asparagine synthase (glutamine-hydrolysing)
VPAVVLERGKQGFDIPAHDWLRGVLRPLLDDTVNEAAVRASGVFHWPAVHELKQRHQRRRVNAGYSLWGLLTLFLWMKRWNIQPAATP